MAIFPYMKSGVAQSEKSERTMQVAAPDTDFASWLLLSISHSDSNVCPSLSGTAWWLRGIKENSMFIFLFALLKQPYYSYQLYHTKRKNYSTDELKNKEDINAWAF